MVCLRQSRRAISLVILWACFAECRDDNCYAFRETLCDPDIREPSKLLEVKFGTDSVACDQRLQPSNVTTKPTVSLKGLNKERRYVLVVLDPDHPEPCSPASVHGLGDVLYLAFYNVSNDVLLLDSEELNYIPPNITKYPHRYQIYLHEVHEGKKYMDIKNYTYSRANFSLTNYPLCPKTAVFQFYVEEKAKSDGTEMQAVLTVTVAALLFLLSL